MVTDVTIKNGYKQTELGVIPENWEVKKVGDICDFVVPGRNKPKNFDGDIPWITTPDIEGNIVTVSKRELYVTKEEAKIVGSKIVTKNSVVMSCVGDLGLVTIAGRDIVINQQLHAFLPNETINPYYLSYALIRRKNYMESVATKTAIPYMNKDNCNSIPIPSKAEQEAIATVLSDTDSLITSLDKLIAKKRDIKQATMQQLLTGKTRLPGFSGEWKMKKLEDVGMCLRGVSYNGENDLSPHDTENTIRLLRSNNVQNASVIKSEVQFVTSARVSIQQVLQAGDILICMANGSKELVGKAGAFRVDDGYNYTFGAFMGCFRTNLAAHPTFVFFLFHTGQYRNYIANLVAGSSINNLKPSDIESLKFSFPGSEEQKAIANVLSDMDAEIAALEQRRDKTRALKQGMMQELLTGKTRLV